MPPCSFRRLYTVQNRTATETQIPPPTGSHDEDVDDVADDGNDDFEANEAGGLETNEAV